MVDTPARSKSVLRECVVAPNDPPSMTIFHIKNVGFAVLAGRTQRLNVIVRVSFHSRERDINDSFRLKHSFPPLGK
jgi:hypothetical protein